MAIQIRLADAMSCSTSEHVYRLCGIDVICDLPLPSLLPFKSDRSEPQATTDFPCDPLLRSPGPVRHETVGFTGGRDRRVVLETGPQGAQIVIAGVGRYALAPDGSRIVLERLDVPAASGLVEECTLGAPLVVALSLRDRWLLHAAAVVVDGYATVIAGASGSGKSTLAATLGREPNCRRIADDLIGLSVNDGYPVALADYPQLKLPAACQSSHGPVEVDTIYLLRSAGRSEQFGIRKIAKSQKLIALARHGVAARLYPADLLARHLAFCRAVAGAVRMVEISYPHTEQALAKAVKVVKKPSMSGSR